MYSLDSKHIMKLIIISTVLTLLGTLFVEQARPNRTDGIPKIETVQIPPVKAVLAVETKEVAQSANITVKVAQSAPVSYSGNIESIIIAAANKYGIDVNRALRIAKCESGLNPNSVNYGYNENGYPSGLYQHLSGYWPARAAKYGYAGASVFDPIANANVTMGMWKDGAAGQWECQ